MVLMLTGYLDMGHSAGLKSVGFTRWNYHDSVGFSADRSNERVGEQFGV